MASYPFTWTTISQEERDERAKMYEDVPASRFINMKRCDQDGLMMPSYFVNNGEDRKIWEMKPRPDDIWIVTYPKCGTTMTQELVWQVISSIKYKTMVTNFLAGLTPMWSPLLGPGP